MFNEKIKPPLVLTLICLITCGLLVAAYQATYTDSTGVITDKLEDGLTDLYGSPDGFEMLRDESGGVLTYAGVTSVLSDGTNTAFEITTDGYSSGGLHVLVGVGQGGTVTGVSILTIGETPGVGTKVQSADFLGQFTGLRYENTLEDDTEPVTAKAAWGEYNRVQRLKIEAQAAGSGGGDSFSLDAITGATFSSRGMYTAVRTALAAYDEMKGAGENG